MIRHRHRMAAALCAVGLIAVSCGSDSEDSADTAAPAGTAAPAAPADTAAPADSAAGTTPAAGGDTGATLKDGEFGENFTPDPTILATGLGGAGSLPTEERARNVALATITRASTTVDEDLALKCWKDNGCDTGTGGKLKVGLADGFGGNIARQIFKMEFILQALTYPEIGHIAYTDANLDTQKAISDVQSFAAQDYDVIVSYPDAGEALVPAYKAATGQGAKVVLWSGAKIGAPGSDYLTYSGSDQCALAHAWGEQFAKSLPDGGDIAIILGAPGNPTDPLEEKCLRETLPSNINIVAKQGTAWSRDAYQQATSAILAEHPDIKGIVGAYGDAFVGCDPGIRGRRHQDGWSRHHAPVRRQPVPLRMEGRGRCHRLVHLRGVAPRGARGDDVGDDEHRRVRGALRDRLRRAAEEGQQRLVPHRHPARRIAFEPGAARAASEDVPGLMHFDLVETVGGAIGAAHRGFWRRTV